MTQVIPVLIAYFLFLVTPFLLLCLYRQRLLHGKPDAKHTGCRLGFHKTNMRRFDNNNYDNRETCALCGYTYPNS